MARPGGQNEAEQPDHPASLGDSITASYSDEVFGTHSRGNSPGSRQRRANEPDWRLCSLRDSSRPRNNAGDSDYADQGEKVCGSPCTYDVPHWPSHPLLRGFMISQCRDHLVAKSDRRPAGQLWRDNDPKSPSPCPPKVQIQIGAFGRKSNWR